MSSSFVLDLNGNPTTITVIPPSETVVVRPDGTARIDLTFMIEQLVEPPGHSFRHMTREEWNAWWDERRLRLKREEEEYKEQRRLQEIERIRNEPDHLLAALESGSLSCLFEDYDPPLFSEEDDFDPFPASNRAATQHVLSYRVG
jgi:hypothetical protein